MTLLGSDAVDNDPGRLFPGFRIRLEGVILEANRESRGKFPEFREWILFEGFRSQARQDALYSMGRTRPGEIVTYKRRSYHSSGLAADVVWRDSSGKLRWDGESRLWEILGHCARAGGLEWGGDFPKMTGGNFVDLPHIQPKLNERLLWKIPAWLFLQRRGLGDRR